MKELGDPNAKARLVTEGLERIAYSKGNKESFPSIDYDDFKMYFTSNLTSIKNSPIFTKMWEMVNTHSMFLDDILPTDEDDLEIEEASGE